MRYFVKMIITAKKSSHLITGTVFLLFPTIFPVKVQKINRKNDLNNSLVIKRMKI